jgi:hypothetical protein
VQLLPKLSRNAQKQKAKTPEKLIESELSLIFGVLI